MTVVYKDIKWREDKLYHGTEFTGYSVVESKRYPNLFYLRFPNGKLSTHFYNFTRVRCNAKDLYLESVNGIATEAILRGSTCV